MKNIFYQQFHDLRRGMINPKAVQSNIRVITDQKPQPVFQGTSKKHRIQVKIEAGQTEWKHILKQLSNDPETMMKMIPTPQKDDLEKQNLRYQQVLKGRSSISIGSTAYVRDSKVAQKWASVGLRNLKEVQPSHHKSLKHLPSTSSVPVKAAGASKRRGATMSQTQMGFSAKAAREALE